MTFGDRLIDNMRALLFFGRKKPTLDGLQRQMRYAVINYAVHAGRYNAHLALVQIGMELGNSRSDMAVTIDIMHMEEVL